MMILAVYLLWPWMKNEDPSRAKAVFLWVERRECVFPLNVTATVLHVGPG